MICTLVVDVSSLKGGLFFVALESKSRQKRAGKRVDARLNINGLLDHAWLFLIDIEVQYVQKLCCKMTYN